jgi:hypothetical protein
MDPAIDRVRGTRADARYANGRWLAETTVDEPPHRQFGGHTASLGAPHAICQCSEEADS